MILQQIQWREPLWLFLVLQPFLLWILIKRSRARHLNAFADAWLQPWLVIEANKQWKSPWLYRRTAYAVAWLLIAIAAAGPRLPLANAQYNNPDATNIVLVMDLSRSMHSEDVAPNRLRRAALELDTFISRAQGQNFGVIVFAARAHVYVPLTWDSNALRYYLRALEKLTLPTYGSQLLPALVLAKQQLEARSGPGAIVLLTDGDFDNTGHSNQPALQQLAQQLKREHFPLYILGVGSSEGGPIPLPDGGWLNVNGKPVISRMNEPLLQQLSKISGGRYSRVRDNDADWRYLYDEGLLRQLPQEMPNNQQRWHELYPWVLMPGVILLFAALFPIKRLNSATVKSVTMCLVLIVSSGPYHKVNASEVDWLQSAQKAYQAAQYDKAIKFYEHISGYQGRFGAGACYYRQGNYQAAERSFSAAILQADTDHQRADALFNLGNSVFQQGDYASAIQDYANVLLYQPEYPAAHTNLALSQALYQLVLKEYENSESANIAGRGPRSARITRPIPLNENMTANIDSQDTHKPVIIPALPETPATQSLLSKGLAFVKLAAKAEQQAPTRQQQQDLAEARLYMLQIEDRPALLWQALFEREEGFDAPQSQPNVIPGIKPW